jgi:hypothetical protein
MSSLLHIPEPTDDELFVKEEYLKIPEWYLKILRQRMADYHATGGAGWTTWEEFEKELEQS